jgi:hypothetical protein
LFCKKKRERKRCGTKKKRVGKPDQLDEENSTSHQTMPVRYVTDAVPVVPTIVMRTIESAGIAEVVEL